MPRHLESGHQQAAEHSENKPYRGDDMMARRQTRRDFMKGSLAAAGVAAASSFTPSAWSAVRGANEDIRVGIAGLNSKGRSHMHSFLGVTGVRIVALCDPDQAILDQRLAELAKLNTDEQGNLKPGRAAKVDGYIDIREMLDNKDIDAIVIATPNHWHALATIWGCQAGKDVYVEKPVSHNIWEGRKMVEAARKYDRIVQAGTQSRSDIALPEVWEYMQQGHLGKIRLARGFCYKRRESIDKVDAPQPVPPSVNYDLWSGPAPTEPVMRQQFHYDWHWQWPTGNGDIGNQGAHQMDICRWAIGERGLPGRVISLGGRFGYLDDGTTPNTQISLLDYHPVPILFEVRGLPVKKGDTGMDHYRGIRVNVVIECEDGYFAGGTGGGSVYDYDGNRIQKFAGDGGGGHQANFIKAVCSRKSSDLHADIEVGHISSALSHMANTSHRLGQDASRSDILDVIGDNEVLVDAFERMQEHLIVNGVDVEATPRQVGPWLEMDADTQRYVGPLAEEANAFICREYRAPYVVPEKV